MRGEARPDRRPLDLGDDALEARLPVVSERFLESYRSYKGAQRFATAPAAQRLDGAVHGPAPRRAVPAGFGHVVDAVRFAPLLDRLGHGYGTNGWPGGGTHAGVGLRGRLPHRR